MGRPLFVAPVESDIPSKATAKSPGRPGISRSPIHRTSPGRWPDRHDRADRHERFDRLDRRHRLLEVLTRQNNLRRHAGRREQDEPANEDSPTLTLHRSSPRPSGDTAQPYSVFLDDFGGEDQGTQIFDLILDNEPSRDESNRGDPSRVSRAEPNRADSTTRRSQTSDAARRRREGQTLPPTVFGDHLHANWPVAYFGAPESRDHSSRTRHPVSASRNLVTDDEMGLLRTRAYIESIERQNAIELQNARGSSRTVVGPSRSSLPRASRRRNAHARRVANSEARVRYADGLDGLGDRHRSPSPADYETSTIEAAWDTLQSTLTPDPQPPSVGSSFASTAASQTNTNDSSTNTSITSPDDVLEPPCDPVNSDTEGDNEVRDQPARPRRAASQGTRRSYADVAASDGSSPEWLEGMHHIVRGLAEREDIPDDWWAEAGLSRSMRFEDEYTI